MFHLAAKPATGKVRPGAAQPGQTSAGSTNVLLRRIPQCGKGGDECVELRPNRLYAGERLELELPETGPAERYRAEIVQAVGLRSMRASC